MFGGLVRLILLRIVGARVLLGIAVFDWLRRTLAGRRDTSRNVTRSRQGSTIDDVEPQAR